MNVNLLVAVAVRITGFIMVLWIINTSSVYLYSFFKQTAADPWLWIVLTPQVMIFTAGICMIVFPRTLADKILPGEPNEETTLQAKETMITVGDIEALACSFVGLYFLVQAVLDTAYLSSLWYSTIQLQYKWIWSPDRFAQCVTIVVEFIVAIWFLFRARGLLGLLRMARSFGAD